jgi:hypothetical protein
MTILIDRPPQVVACTIDGQKHLIEVPFVTRSGPAATQLIGILPAKLAISRADRFIGDDDPTGEQQLFDIALDEAEMEVQPDAIAENLGREAVVLVTVGGWCAHATSLAHWADAGEAA